MFGFHRRTRSLIPVKDLARYEKVAGTEEQEFLAEEDEFDSETTEPAGSNRTQLTWIYVVFLAEAIMASSLQPQLKMLVSSNEQYCSTLSGSYLRSILDCAYAFGASAGILWGYLADRVGRRTVALAGLYGMSVCCLSMGFATDLIACTILRFIAGLVSSAIVVSTLTMLGDVSRSPEERTKNVSRLPIVGVCGSVGPLIQGMVAGSINAHGAIWEKFPILSSQIACGSLVLVIAIAATFVLNETLPQTSNSADESDMDCEKAAFLGQALSDDVPSIHIVDFTRPEPISIGQFLQAPSLIVLMCSFCLLSLHASSFDVVLPHLGHSSSRHGGMGIPCDWLGLILLAVRAIAGAIILRAMPKIIEKFGLLRPFRSCALFFPALYIITPLLAFLTMCSTPVTAIISSAAIMIKHLLAGGAQVLVILLMLNVAPDAFSAGTVIGLMQAASLFKALAVAVSGASFYLSTDFSVATTNYALWTSLAVFGAAGSGLAWFVRERPSVERDFPAEVLCWETCFDAEGEQQV
ncbi:Major facilitator superfamily [Lasiodiplodia theobromae]|uniref:Multidrug resistance protein MdtG n=2 Tax=Lasiodiplodia TaxID=66739 RepID=A0A5N5D9K0_9PEZI|nr:MFS transporter [Lasiodiplodia theobromae]KAB2573982.1 Multidrug resistance protein MdtG [Lasiodiplodia theobromae]KAF4538303.1 MFS transporter [Lasiodiplodia theobromae]KAF9633387.1 Major facilitator superfamily [Lasiodiplodia theobromae]KAK0654375.1 Multidrug resistance protein MdtG [Lasiodiplodia hormozganensis]